MQKKAKHKIVILGCGNVAWHLAKHFSELKKYGLFIYNHKKNAALNEFKSKFKCTVATDFNKIINDADFYFICVADKFVSLTVKNIHTENADALIIHTSGSLPIDALGNTINAAVFYPLQTFSKNDSVNWKEVPIIIETKSKASKAKITSLAKEFSEHVIDINYEDRLRLHLAAVLVNNFTNALFVSAADLVSENGETKFNLLMPLIKQTVLKAGKIKPREAQTGPAKRNDKGVIKKHLKLLTHDTDLKKTYKQLSNLIIKQQQKKHA